MEQRFETKRGLAAIGIVKGLFRGPQGNVPTQELVALAGHPGEMEKSAILEALDDFEQQLKTSSQTE
jgi:hypothetical protein